MKKNKRPKLRKRAWVVIDFPNLHPLQRESYEQYRGRRFIYLGDIPNQPEHALIMELGANNEKGARSGVMVTIVHTDELIEIDVADT